MRGAKAALCTAQGAHRALQALEAFADVPQAFVVRGASHAERDGIRGGRRGLATDREGVRQVLRHRLLVATQPHLDGGKRRDE